VGRVWRGVSRRRYGASYELGQQEGVVASLVMMLSGVTMVLIAPLVVWDV
jgi:putative effector of murein hydrolase